MARTFGILLLTIALAVYNNLLPAQSGAPFYSAYQSGMLQSDQFSTDQAAVSVQPSILSRQKSPIFSGNVQSLFTGFNVWGLGLHIASPLLNHFGAGISVTSLGHPDYQSTHITVGAARLLSHGFAIGISHRFQTTKVANENRPWSGSSSIGGGFDNDSWGIALHLTGLMQWNKSHFQEGISVYSSSYFRLQQQTRLIFALSYSNGKIQPTTGVRQRIIKNVELFGAFQWYPARYGVGFIFPLAEQLESIFSTKYHPVLGWSPALGLRWRGKVN